MNEAQKAQSSKARIPPRGGYGKKNDGIEAGKEENLQTSWKVSPLLSPWKRLGFLVRARRGRSIVRWRGGRAAE